MTENFEAYNLGLSSDWYSSIASGGQIFESSMFGLAAAILSFATNSIATCLVMYKAWYVPKLTGLRVRTSLTSIVDSTGDTGEMFPSTWHTSVVRHREQE